MKKAPVLFLIYCREEISLKSFASIKKYKPDRLYIAADGPKPKKSDDLQLCESARKSILDAIDWDCDVRTLFQDRNLGCGMGVYTAIDWFFQTEEMGIIMEDDCVAQASFFRYIEVLLNRYSDDNRVGMIAGFNPIDTFSSDFSYCFSKYKVCWGWATWRRAWKNMDFSLKWMETSQCDSIYENMGYRSEDVYDWKYKLKKIKCNAVDTWDWQWFFSLASQNQLCIFPSVNLVSNIGFGKGATHTKKLCNIYAKSDIDFPLRHPHYMIPNHLFDKMYYKQQNSFMWKIRAFLPISFNKIVSSLFRKLQKVHY